MDPDRLRRSPESLVGKKIKTLTLFFQKNGLPAIPIERLGAELEKTLVVRLAHDTKYGPKSELLVDQAGRPELRDGGVLRCDYGDNGSLYVTDALPIAQYSVRELGRRILRLARFPNGMPADRLAALSRALPRTKSKDLGEALEAPDTFWYDKASMPGVYQDSVPPFIGLRSNHSTLSYGAGQPTFFDGFGFRFPFNVTGGTHRCVGLAIAHFVRLPKIDGKSLPIVWWNEPVLGWDGQHPTDMRVTYHWMFPIGTLVGEIMSQLTPKRTHVVFEIRTRKREARQWRANAHRPFPSAKRLKAALERKRPEGKRSASIARLIEHLGNESRFRTGYLPDPYSATPIGIGGIDALPPFNDDDLVTELLTETEFEPSVGVSWKESGEHRVHAPANEHGGYSIVPVNYDGGVLPVDSQSCASCHRHAGRKISDFMGHLSLYGQLWGSDEVYSWSPFNAAYANDANANNFVLRQDFIEAGVLEPYDPAKHKAEHYQKLPRIWR